MSRWFVEIRNGDRWHAQVFHDHRPVRKTLNGKRVFRRDPVEIHPDHQKCTVNQLFELYSPEGKFAAQNGIVRETERNPSQSRAFVGI